MHIRVIYMYTYTFRYICKHPYNPADLRGRSTLCKQLQAHNSVRGEAFYASPVAQVRANPIKAKIQSAHWQPLEAWQHVQRDLLTVYVMCVPFMPWAYVFT